MKSWEKVYVEFLVSIAKPIDKKVVGYGIYLVT